MTSQRPRVASGSLGAIVRSYKAAVTNKITRGFDGASHVWQRNHCERIIRNEYECKGIHVQIQPNRSACVAENASHACIFQGRPAGSPRIGRACANLRHA
jgi:hypothetical protein